MKRASRIVGLAVTAVVGALVPTAGASVVLPGNLVVLREGDGVNDPYAASTTSALSLQEYTAIPSAPAVQTVNLPSTGADRITLGNNVFTGHVALHDGFLAFGGYDIDANQSTTGTSTALRKVVGFNIAQDLAAGPQMGATTTLYQGAAADSGNGSIRAAVVSGNLFYTAGSGSSTYYISNGDSAAAGTTIASDSSAMAAQRSINIYNGNLYVSTGATGGKGILGYTGSPTTSVATPPLVIQTGALNPNDAWFSPDGSTAYVVAENTGVGIMKFGRNQTGGYDHLYDISIDYDGAGAVVGNGYYMAVDDSGVNPVIYAVNTDGKTLTSVSDLGDATTSSATLQVLQTAGDNYRFRGLAVVPAVPEPASLGLLALGGGLLLGRRRHV